MFANKTVIVTGGAGALGREVVRWFSARGAQVGVLISVLRSFTRLFPLLTRISVWSVVT